MGKSQTDFSAFESLDMRVGRVISVEETATRKPTYRMRVDFGNEVGLKTTCGAYKNYRKEDLLGRLVIGLLNVGSKKMGSEVSEFLLLGVKNEKGETVYLAPESDAPLGAAVF